MTRLLTLICLLTFVTIAYSQEEPAKMEAKQANPVLRIMTSKGDIYVELYEDECPNTVANIITLAESGFYRGMTFIVVRWLAG